MKVSSKMVKRFHYIKKSLLTIARRQYNKDPMWKIVFLSKIFKKKIKVQKFFKKTLRNVNISESQRFFKESLWEVRASQIVPW